MSLAGMLLTPPRLQFCDANGAPYAAGVLSFFTAGTSTPCSVYSTSVLDVALGTTVTLDAAGRAPAIYLAAGGVKVQLADSDGVVIWTQDLVENVAETYLAGLGTSLAGGSSDVSSGYAIVAADQFVTVASTGGANPCLVNLPSADAHANPIGIKNLGTVPLAITPNGADTIDGTSGAFTVPGASGSLYPSVWLVSDSVSNWLIVASHALVVPRQVQGTAAPTTGTWVRGDIVWNSAPSAAGVPGWMCVLGGSPGTWVSMASLAAA